MILLLLSLVFAAPTQENHEDIIQKAKTLMLQRDRDKALQVLQFSMQKENKNTQAGKRLVQTMNQMGEMVFTEKGQQTLEIAESLVNSDPQQAIDSYKEALKIEESNIYIELQLARAYMYLDDCKNAAASADAVLQLHPWYEPAVFLFAQAKVCDSSSFVLKDSQISFIENDITKHYVMIAQNHSQKEHAKVLRETDVAIKKFPNFSEFYWFRAQALQASQLNSSKETQKYNELCNTKPSPLPALKYLLYSCKNKDKK
jgi:hypothetical protein